MTLGVILLTKACLVLLVVMGTSASAQLLLVRPPTQASESLPGIITTDVHSESGGMLLLPRRPPERPNCSTAPATSWARGLAQKANSLPEASRAVIMSAFEEKIVVDTLKAVLCSKRSVSFPRVATYQSVGYSPAIALTLLEPVSELFMTSYGAVSIIQSASSEKPKRGICLIVPLA